MEEQRYVVEITRPVPPEKVEQVSQRIAARLNVPQERIFTLLDGRVGDVTKPVLSDKADAIAEVFAEAGVRVIVSAARVEPPFYEEQFGQPESSVAEQATRNPDDQPAEADVEQDATAYGGHAHPGDDFGEHVEADAGTYDDQVQPAEPEPAVGHSDSPPWHEPAAWGVDTSEAETWHRAEGRPADKGDEDTVELGFDPPEHASDEDTDGAAGSYDYDEADYQIDFDEPEPFFDYSADQSEEAISEPLFGLPNDDEQPEMGDDADTAFTGNISSGYETTEVYVYSDEDPEDEADRLGPPTRRLRVEYEQKPVHPDPGHPDHEHADPEHADPEHADPEQPKPAQASSFPSDYAASTRWTPSPHDPYAFTPEDSPSFAGRRATPVGPAHTTPLTAPTPVPRNTTTREGVGGFYSPEYTKQPSDGPQLRTYLLWALVVSLVVLIVLQFVFASRVDGAVAVGAFEAGLLAYRKGDFGAARQAWEPLADSGNTQAQYYMGFMLQNGLGQPWSNARAANWYRRAAQQGHTKSQLALGSLYLRGMGVEEDARIGASWYASAAVAGDPEGQFEYARLLLHGTGVEKDMHGALAWFEAAAANGVGAAADYVEYARTLAADE